MNRLLDFATNVSDDEHYSWVVPKGLCGSFLPTSDLAQSRQPPPSSVRWYTELEVSPSSLCNLGLFSQPGMTHVNGMKTVDEQIVREKVDVTVKLSLLRSSVKMDDVIPSAHSS